MQVFTKIPGYIQLLFSIFRGLNFFSFINFFRKDVTFGKGVTGDMQACAQGFFRLSSLKKPLSGFKSKRAAVDWINKFFVCNQVASKCSAHTLIDRVWIVKSVAS